MARPPANKGHHPRYANIFLEFPGWEASAVTISIRKPSDPDENVFADTAAPSRTPGTYPHRVLSELTVWLSGQALPPVGSMAGACWQAPDGHLPPNIGASSGSVLRQQRFVIWPEGC